MHLFNSKCVPLWQQLITALNPGAWSGYFAQKKTQYQMMDRGYKCSVFKGFLSASRQKKNIIYRTNSTPGMVKIFFQIEINSNLISGLKNVTTS